MEILTGSWMPQFCLESKIRHSTIKYASTSAREKFCLESKIRHSTICSGW